jgi:Holliday junction resolvase RusA-like endonuclease
MDWAPKVPLTVILDFTMPATLKDRTGWCAVRPDIDKLCRAVLDGLTDAGTVADDSQIAQLIATKKRGLKAGVQVTIERLGDTDGNE